MFDYREGDAESPTKKNASVEWRERATKDKAAMRMRCMRSGRCTHREEFHVDFFTSLQQRPLCARQKCDCMGENVDILLMYLSFKASLLSRPQIFARKYPLFKVITTV